MSWESLRDIGGFSAYMLGQRRSSNAGQRRPFLIGRFLGTAALGVYAVAYNTMLVPASKLGGPLQRVFSPAFSRIQDEPERIAATWARVAPPDRRDLGSGARRPGGRRTRLRAARARQQWDAAVPVVQVLAWVGIIQALQAINMDILLAVVARARCSASRSS